MGRGKMRIASAKLLRELVAEEVPKKRVKGLRKKLEEAGMLQYQVRLLLSRYVDNRSFSDIAKELGWTSSNRVSYHLKQALSELKKRGFK